MSAAADHRKEILERVRAATAGTGWSVGFEDGDTSAAKGGEKGGITAGDYVRRGSLSSEARLELMAERLREYDAVVVECQPEAVAAAIREQLKASGRQTFVAPAGLPEEWLAPEFRWRIDGDLPVDEIEGADGVVTGCSCAVAESGTIVLHHGPAEGRRVISLLPDWHLCVIRSSQVVETLPEYFDRCAIREQGTGNIEQNKSPALVTWISGPSATADIEMTRIKGVHGPRFLNVVLVKEQGPGNREQALGIRH